MRVPLAGMPLDHKWSKQLIMNAGQRKPDVPPVVVAYLLLAAD